MKVHIVGKSRPPLPKPPFVLQRSPGSAVTAFLDTYPEIEGAFAWIDSTPLREYTPHQRAFLFFYSNGDVTCGRTNGHPSWPIVKW